MKEKVWEVADLNGLATAVREDVFDTEDIGMPHESIGMDGYVTVGQVAQMLESTARKVGKKLFVTAKSIDEARRMVVDAITSAALARLAANDILDVCWSDEDNEFKFYLKEEEVSDDN